MSFVIMLRRLIFIRLCLLSFLLVGQVVPSIAAKQEFKFDVADEGLFRRPQIDLKIESDVSDLLRDLGDQTLLRARFVQHKAIKILSRPIVSSGTLLFSDNHGLHWQVMKPYPNALTVTSKKIVQRIDGERSEITAAQQPAAFQFANILFSLFGGDIESLSEHFEVHLVRDNERWQIGLLPRDKQIKKMLKRIVLFGVSSDRQTYITQIDMIDSTGDSTQIVLHVSNDVTTSDMTDVERRYFD